MFTFEKIKLYNFISYQDCQFDFVQKSVTTVFGINETDKGQKNNGSGKTALFLDAICFALVGETTSIREGDDLIRDEQELCNVQLTLNHLTDKFVINRTVFRDRRSSIIKVTKNDQILVFSGTKETNEFILTTIGICKNDLFDYFLLTKDQYQPFLSLTDTNKKASINRICGADKLIGIDSEIKKDIASEQQKIALLRQQLIYIENQLTQQLDQIDIYKQQQSLSNKQQQIEAINKSIEQLVDQKKQFIQSLGEFSTQVQNIEQQRIQLLESIDQTGTQSIAIKIDSWKQKLQQQQLLNRKYQSELSTVRTDIGKYNIFLKHSITCPNCSHVFNVNNTNLSISDVKDKLQNSTIQETELTVTLDGISKNITFCEEKIRSFEIEKRTYDSKIQSIQSQVRQCDIQIKQQQQQIQQTERLIVSNDKNMLLLLQNIKQITDLDNVELIKICELKINQLLDEQVQVESQIQLHTTEISQLTSLILNFKTFNSFVANKYIEQIEVLINYYLNLIGSNLTIALTDKVQTKSKTVRDKIDVKVYRDGVIKGRYQKFSGGERMRIDICCILAISDMINQSCQNGGIDYIVLDELFGSLDSEGAIEAIDILNKVGRTIIILSPIYYEEWKSEKYNTIKIIKQNNISQIT